MSAGSSLLRHPSSEEGWSGLSFLSRNSSLLGEGLEVMRTLRPSRMKGFKITCCTMKLCSVYTGRWRRSLCWFYLKPATYLLMMLKECNSECSRGYLGNFSNVFHFCFFPPIFLFKLQPSTFQDRRIGREMLG